MITGVHALVFSKDAEAVRAFFRDVLGLASVDAGGGWLIFALPPAELAGAYWRNVYPLMPEGYRSGECRAGGAMDERLADAPWLAPLPS